MPSASSLRKSATSAPKLQGGPYPENAYSLSKSSKAKSHFLSFQGFLDNWEPRIWTNVFIVEDSIFFKES